jgi:hypothetical protein
MTLHNSTARSTSAGDGGYTAIPQRAMWDPRMSWAAKGLLMDLISRPGSDDQRLDQVLSEPHNQHHFKEILGLALELQAHGYLELTPIGEEG